MHKIKLQQKSCSTKSALNIHRETSRKYLPKGFKIQKFSHKKRWIESFFPPNFVYCTLTNVDETSRLLTFRNSLSRRMHTKQRKTAFLKIIYWKKEESILSGRRSRFDYLEQPEGFVMRCWLYHEKKFYSIKHHLPLE